VIEKGSDVGLGAPDEDHAVTEHLVRESQLLLSVFSSTNESIDVVFQSTLMNMPWRLVAHFCGSAERILLSERSR